MTLLVNKIHAAAFLEEPAPAPSIHNPVDPHAHYSNLLTPCCCVYCLQYKQRARTQATT